MEEPSTDLWIKCFTGAEDAELLSGRYEVEVCGEEVHKRAGIHHEHEHPEAVHSHLLPAGDWKIFQIRNCSHKTHEKQNEAEAGWKISA